jgi:hypothetical protein
MRLCPLAEFTDLLPWICTGSRQQSKNRRSEILAATNYRQRNHRDRYTNSTGRPLQSPSIGNTRENRIPPPQKKKREKGNLSAPELKSGDDDGVAIGSETDGYGAGIQHAAEPRDREVGGDPEPHLWCCLLFRLVAGRCESRWCRCRCRCGVELAMPPPPSTYLPFTRHLPSLPTPA